MGSSDSHILYAKYSMVIIEGVGMNWLLKRAKQTQIR